MARIGVLGGTFDPIHLGHLILAEQSADQFELDKVLIMPSGISYFKEKRGILPAKDRFAMVKAAVASNHRFEASDLEMKRPGKTYTADTITELNKLYPDDQIYFITGADTLFQMDTWHDPQRIFAGCHILVAVRNESSIESLKSCIKDYEIKFGARINLLHTTEIDVSSTMIRKNISEGKSVRYYLPDQVIEYIVKNKLYL